MPAADPDHYVVRSQVFPDGRVYVEWSDLKLFIREALRRKPDLTVQDLVGRLEKGFTTDAPE